MPTKTSGLVIAALFASVGFAQPPVERVIHFTHGEPDRVLQETATDARGITEMPEASVDTAERTVTLRGAPDQIALAEWLVKQWERSAPGPHEYRISNDDIVRVFYVAHAATPRELQEIATDVRTIAEIRRLFTYNEPNVITARGEASQITLAEWLVNQLDEPANAAAHEYRPSGAADDVVRVLHTAHTATPRELQEIATDVRTIAEIRRLFTHNGSNALILRGTAVQMALAEWLVKQLDEPASAAGHEFRPSGATDDVVRVYYTSNTTTPRQLQEIATDVRTIAEIRRLFTYNKSNALALRGTSAQIALAAWLLNELDQPANQPRTPAPHEYRPSGADDDVVGVFFLTHADSLERLQEIATEVRVTTEVKRLLIYNTPHAMTARGTAAQIALAGRLITEKDR